MLDFDIIIVMKKKTIQQKDIVIQELLQTIQCIANTYVELSNDKVAQQYHQHIKMCQDALKHFKQHEL